MTVRIDSGCFYIGYMFVEVNGPWSSSLFLLPDGANVKTM